MYPTCAFAVDDFFFRAEGTAAADKCYYLFSAADGDTPLLLFKALMLLELLFY
jgi:hypothetical protein